MFVVVTIFIPPPKGQPIKIPQPTKVIRMNFGTVSFYNEVEYNDPMKKVGAETLIQLGPTASMYLKEKTTAIDKALMTAKCSGLV